MIPQSSNQEDRTFHNYQGDEITYPRRVPPAIYPKFHNTENFTDKIKFTPQKANIITLKTQTTTAKVLSRVLRISRNSRLKSLHLRWQDIGCHLSENIIRLIMRSPKFLTSIRLLDSKIDYFMGKALGKLVKTAKISNFSTNLKTNAKPLMKFLLPISKSSKIQTLNVSAHVYDEETFESQGFLLKNFSKGKIEQFSFGICIATEFAPHQQIVYASYHPKFLVDLIHKFSRLQSFQLQISDHLNLEPPELNNFLCRLSLIPLNTFKIQIDQIDESSSLVQVFADKIKKFEHLNFFSFKVNKHLDISALDDDSQDDHFRDLIINLSKLKKLLMLSLSLSGHFTSPVNEGKVHEAFKHLSNFSNLEKLQLRLEFLYSEKNKIDYSFLSGLTKLKELKIIGEKSGKLSALDEFASCLAPIASIPTLESLNLKFVVNNLSYGLYDLSRESGQAISESLAKMTNLKKLKLKMRSVNLTALESLGLAIRKLKNLESLKLYFDCSSNDFDAGFTNLVYGLSYLEKLKYFTLSFDNCHSVYDYTLIKLAAAIPKMKRLRELKMHFDDRNFVTSRYNFNLNRENFRLLNRKGTQSPEENLSNPDDEPQNKGNDLIQNFIKENGSKSSLTESEDESSDKKPLIMLTKPKEMRDESKKSLREVIEDLDFSKENASEILMAQLEDVNDYHHFIEDHEDNADLMRVAFAKAKLELKHLYNYYLSNKVRLLVYS